MSRLKLKDAPACPYINQGDVRCARHFTLGKMAEAFQTCLGGYRRCHTYHQLHAEQALDCVQITLDGKAYLDTRTLRATGS